MSTVSSGIFKKQVWVNFFQKNWRHCTSWITSAIFDGNLKMVKGKESLFQSKAVIPSVVAFILQLHGHVIVQEVVEIKWLKYRNSWKFGTLIFY